MRLSDNTTMIICQKTYVKPADETQLIAHMKRMIMTNNIATKKRKEKQSQSLPSDELLEKVRNHDVKRIL